MGVMPLIILFSLVVAGGFAIAFVVAARGGQYDDTQTPAMRMLFDDEQPRDQARQPEPSPIEMPSTIHHNLHGRVR
jgi:cbb3-type cytochrome oxidase maturation protein